MDNPSSNKRGILKNPNPKSNKRRNRDSVKSTHFDEQNVKRTYHPADKTYGFMKIDEPKTPHPGANSYPVSSEELRRRLETLRKTEYSSSSSDEKEETPEERKRREEFERRRRLSYQNEFKLAKEMKKKLKDDFWADVMKRFLL